MYSLTQEKLLKFKVFKLKFFDSVQLVQLSVTH